jgi:hypothetical protein
LATPPIFTTSSGQGGVEQRRERRALAAGGDVGGAEIMHNLHAAAPGKGGGVADLPGPARGRVVQNGLAMKADHIGGLAQHGDGDGVVRRQALFHVQQERIIRRDAGGEVQQPA